MADVNTAFRGGMAIYEIRRGEDVAALSARVARRYHVSGDSPSAIPAGPLDDLYPDRRMVLVCEDVYSTKEKKLMIFLYGIWADKFEFAKVNNYIQIWGGENIVLDYHAHAHGPRMADCCICISDRSEKDENGIEIETLDSKVALFYGSESKDYFSVTSSTVAEAEAPLVHMMKISGEKRPREAFGSGAVNYVYHSLQEVIEAPENSRVNVYGIVAGFQQAKSCAGTHKFVSTFSLIDPTNKYHTSPVVVNMFCHKKECFPDIVKIGDVVRFHRAKKNKVQDKTVLTTYGDGGEHSNIVFHRRVDHLSGFPVVHAPLDHDGAADATPLSPKSDRYGRINIMMSDGVIIFPYLHVQEWSYQTNSQHVTFTPQDADRVKNLYNWGIQSLHRYSLHDIHIPLNSLRDVLESNSEVQVTKFDLVCLVLSNPSRHLDGSYTLKVWDASLSNIIVGGVGPGMQILVGDLEKELKNVFAHCMGWPVEFVAQLQSGSFCPGSCEGDLTAGGDVAALAEWYRPRLDQFSADQTLLQQLTEDILNRYAVIHIVDAPSQDRYIRKHARPGSWVRIRDVEVESETRVADSSISSPVVEKKLKMTCRTHVNKILPYFRDVINIFDRFLSMKASGQMSLRNVMQSPAEDEGGKDQANCIVVKDRPMLSSKGEPLTNLALCISSTPPAVFCCFARIVDWYPRDLSLFVRDDPSKATSSKRPKVFLFSVKIADDSATRDVILFKEDAELFFGGVTSEQFRRNLRGLRGNLERRLIEAIQNKTFLEFHLKLYTTLDKKNVAIKRLSVFNTSLF